MITPIDLQQIANLHMASLPESAVTQLGNRFVLSFYGYIQSSKKEWIEVVTKDSKMIGVAVLSLEPKTLPRRLLFNTSLLVHLIKNFFSQFPRKLKPSRGSYPSDPELILLFVDTQYRNAGVGGQLIRQIESRLVSCKQPEYWVKTELESGNSASVFYKKNNFLSIGTLIIHGNHFEVLKKNLPPHG